MQIYQISGRYLGNLIFVMELKCCRFIRRWEIFFSGIGIILVLLSYVGIYLVVSVDVCRGRQKAGSASFRSSGCRWRIAARGWHPSRRRIECPHCVHGAAQEQPYSDILKAIFALHLRRVVFARVREGLFRAEETFRRLLNYFGVKDNQEHPWSLTGRISPVVRFDLV